MSTEVFISPVLGCAGWGPAGRIHAGSCVTTPVACESVQEVADSGVRHGEP